jgi:hypothetical protein
LGRCLSDPETDLVTVLGHLQRRMGDFALSGLCGGGGLGWVEARGISAGGWWALTRSPSTACGSSPPVSPARVSRSTWAGMCSNPSARPTRGCCSAPPSQAGSRIGACLPRTAPEAGNGEYSSQMRAQFRVARNLTTALTANHFHPGNSCLPNQFTRLSSRAVRGPKAAASKRPGAHRARQSRARFEEHPCRQAFAHRGGRNSPMGCFATAPARS